MESQGGEHLAGSAEQAMRELDETVAYIRERYRGTPEVAIVLGSGLGKLADEVELDKRAGVKPFAYAELPHFPRSTVAGHAGRMVVGKLGKREVLVMQGRSHYYEGYSLSRITQAVRVAGRLGAKVLLVTNSAGSASKEFRPGDLMAITDHINLLGGSPLRGPNPDTLGTRFPDMSAAYDRGLLELARQVAKDLAVPLKQGVYLATHGPNYETPAEVRMMRTLGADAIGMSTVPEVIVARHMGMRVLGISCITNLAAGISATPLSHREVIETTTRVQERFLCLLRVILERMS